MTDSDAREREDAVGWPERASWVAEGFRDAQRFRLRLSLRSTPAERLRDLEAMLDFTSEAEALNPRLRWIALRLREGRGRG